MGSSRSRPFFLEQTNPMHVSEFELRIFQHVVQSLYTTTTPILHWTTQMYVTNMRHSNSMGTAWNFTDLLLEKQEIICNVGFGLQFWRSAIHTAKETAHA